MITQLDLKTSRKSEPITNISNLNPVFVLSDYSIRKTIRVMIESGHRSLPVIDKNGKLDGIITLTDILDAFLRYENFNESTSRIMSREVIFANSNDTTDFTLQKMKVSRKGRIPIINSKKEVVGIVSERDFIRDLSNKNLDKSVSAISVKKPLFVSPKIPIMSCIRMIVNTRYRRFPVVENQKVVGIITAYDLVKDLEKVNFRHNFVNGEVADLMAKEVISVKPEDDISIAAKLMTENRVGMLPVIDNDKLYGIVTERNILEELT